MSEWLPAESDDDYPPGTEVQCSDCFALYTVTPGTDCPNCSDGPPAPWSGRFGWMQISVRSGSEER